MTKIFYGRDALTEVPKLLEEHPEPDTPVPWVYRLPAWKEPKAGYWMLTCMALFAGATVWLKRI